VRARRAAQAARWGWDAGCARARAAVRAGGPAADLCICGVTLHSARCDPGALRRAPARPRGGAAPAGAAGRPRGPAAALPAAVNVRCAPPPQPFPARLARCVAGPGARVLAPGLWPSGAPPLRRGRLAAALGSAARRRPAACPDRACVRSRQRAGRAAELQGAVRARDRRGARLQHAQPVRHAALGLTAHRRPGARAWGEGAHGQRPAVQVAGAGGAARR